MLHFIFDYLWNGLVGWVGITGLILIGAIFVYIKVPVASVRHAAISVATVCLCILFLYPKAYLDGERHVQAKWKKQEQAMRALGEHARADAVRDAASGVCDPNDSDGC